MSTSTPVYKKQKYKLYLLEWNDAYSECTWATRNDIIDSDGDMTISEVGWIIDEDDQSVVISSQVASDGDFGNRTRIPKSWIVRKKKIKLST